MGLMAWYAIAMGTYETVCDLGTVEKAVFGGLCAIVCLALALLPSYITVSFLTLALALSFIASVYWLYNYARLSKISGPIETPSKEKGKRKMKVRILNLDDALLHQPQLIEKYKPEIHDAVELGPHIRMGCGYEHFKWLENHMKKTMGETDGKDGETMVTFFGSNDFHHVSLALIRRIRQPINAVLFDVHPDYLWNPFGHHCGTWYNHVTSLPTVHKAFHFGGASGEFEDEVMIHLAPWHHIDSGKMPIFPANKHFTGGKWDETDTPLLRNSAFKQMTRERAMELLLPYKDELAARPLYITVDKDCLTPSYCLQNWNSGILTGPEILTLIDVLIELSHGRVIAIDITGDWSKPIVKGWMRNILHSQQHADARNNLPPAATYEVNTRMNMDLLQAIEEGVSKEYE